MIQIIFKSVLVIILTIFVCFFVTDYIAVKELSYSYCELANNSINLNNVFINKYGFDYGIRTPLKNPICKR